MRRFLCLTALLFAAFSGSARAQDAVLHPDPDAPLLQRWEWATSPSRNACGQGCWIGYGIQRMMGADSYTGWHIGGSNDHPTLQSLVYGREVEPTPSAMKRAVGTGKMLKEVAVLLRVDGHGKAVSDVRLSNISLPVHLDGLPLMWLGRADQSESFRFLKREYDQADDADMKEELVSAIGMHDADETVPFLKQVLASREVDDVREQAVFWLAESKQSDMLPLLERTARRDASEDIREQAVFGISRIETDAADELLIALARTLEDREIREDAVFWLGQKASRKAIEHLEDIAENDPDVEIQKKAVFALSELPADEGVPRLISIAKTHRNPKIRHEAIFWLGESGDPRAVDLLVEIVRGR